MDELREIREFLSMPRVEALVNRNAAAGLSEQPLLGAGVPVNEHVRDDCGEKRDPE